MTMLNGSLDTVALPDVLRLIASSGKSGLIRVDNASPSGRIFIVDGRIAFATTRNEDDPIDDLLHMEYRADYVGSPEDRRVVDLNDLLESNPEAFNRFLEQMVVEVMSRMLRVNEGQFRFDVDIRSRREISHSFAVEDMISQASTRSDAWARIFDVVPSASALFRMAPRLNEAEEVVLGTRDWALLATTGAATSINEIAQKLKIFEFAAAKKVAELAERNLIEFFDTEVSQASIAATELLSDVVINRAEVLEARSAESNDPEEAPGEADLAVVTDSEELIVESHQEPDLTPEDEESSGADGPTWLPVATDPDDNDPVPLLEELHRLHEAETAAGRQPDQRPDAEGEAQENDDDEEDFDVDDIDGGDLATRWKNLRKAKRGVHAANE